MDLEITEGLSMRLIKEEEGGFLISAEKSETAAEECVLSLFGRFLSSNSYNRQAIREVMQRAWRMGTNLRIVDVGNNIFQFQFPTASQWDWVFDNGPWLFDNDVLLLHRW
jgi:hypothetical protein